MKIKSAVTILGCILAVAANAQVGSIWQSNRRVTSSLFCDAAACNVGDLITIVVNLQTSATKDKNTDTSKASTVADTITELGYGRSSSGQSDGDFDWFRYRDQNPKVGWSASQAFKGGGKIKDAETLTTTMQARVIDVLPNGSLQVEGRRIFEVGKERSTIVITGFVRREDLDVSNSVSSTKIADLQIRQEGLGPLSRSQRKGWLTTLYEIISPF